MDTPYEVMIFDKVIKEIDRQGFKANRDLTGNLFVTMKKQRNIETKVYKGLTRYEAKKLFRLRSHHAGVGCYKTKFLGQSEECPKCGASETIEHLMIICRESEQERREITEIFRQKKVQSNLYMLLGGFDSEEENLNIVGNEATNTPAFTSDLYNQEETEVFLYAINKDSSKDEISAEISVYYASIPVDLNKAIKRPYYPVPSFNDAVAELDGVAVFSRLDARSGYWILPLSTRSSYYTTFSTIYSQYRWKRYPFSLVSAQDEFQKKMEEAFEGLEGIRILVDDILVYGKNREVHDQRLSAVLRRARKKGIRFNSEKCEFSKDKVKYFGHIISRDGIKPDPEKIRAIQDMPSPQSKEELQTLLGMLNFLSKYILDLSSKNKPLRDLTKATDFRWETDHEASMKEIKSCISENLAFFDHKCIVVELKVDASKHGLGAELSSNGKIVGFASRALSTTEQNYSQLEKQLYAIVFGCKHFHHYIYGRKTIVTTDHRPLETILSRPLHTAPARLQRMMIQIQPYDIKVHYSPGSDIPVPDALSRLHLPDVDTKMQNDIEVFVHTVMKSLPVSDSKLDEIRRETEKDTQLKAVKELILKGWPGTRQSSKEQERQKRYHDKTAKPLREPQLEDQVFIQKKTNGPWTKAKIISCHDNPRSYVVETEDGSRLRRNRVHISRHSFPVAKEEVRIQPTTQDKSNDISHPILTESPQPIRTDIETSPRNVPLPREEGEPSDPPLVAPTIVPTPENAAPDCPATGTKSPTTTSKVMPHTRSGRVVRPDL
ncbi:hypothetical protein QYM36_012977 [Artemia franciscana]|uniref:Reverse transcriptase domain-containing protein n=1 Tax=Artemia franciscana TaxID=6661 RepID=A0AA88HF52_ARTSF|nr:hypothetical protein QYM36_012977 [Artemia franciscana]